MQIHHLKTARELRRWSQSHVADQIGVSTRTVMRWEQGHALPYPYYREKLCLLFDMDAQSLGLLPNQDLTQAVTPPAASLTPKFLPPAPVIPDIFDPAIPEALGQTNRLLGRDSLLIELKRRLLTDNILALTALQGLPGVGKTALAVALASDAEVQAHFPDGVLWAGLGPQPNLQNILTRWGSLLNIAATDLEDPTSLLAWARVLKTTIGTRRMLLIIDDAWQGQSALALQVGGPLCAHLLTTRLPQVAFDFAQREAVMVTELDEADGLALLARYVPQIVQAEPEASLALVRAMGGLPLALNLQGKALAMQTYSGQPRRVRTALARALDSQLRLHLRQPTLPNESFPALTDAHTISLQATIDVSMQQLDPVEQAALVALALFPAKPNSFSEEAGMAVSGTSVETLDTLWDSGLLESNGPGRYSLHQTIADYMRTPDIVPVVNEEHSTQARQRLVSYMVQYIKTHEHDYEALEREMSNIMTALDMASELKMWLELFEGGNGLMSFMHVRGLYRQSEQYMQQGLQAGIELGDQERQIKALAHLANLAELQGDYDQAEEYGLRGLTLARELDKKEAMSILLTTLSLVAFNRGDSSRAVAYCEEGLRLSRELGANERTSLLLNNFGRVAHAQGNYSQAEARYNEGLALARQSGNQELVSRQLTALGGIAIEQSNYALTEKYSQEGLSIARRLGYREIIGYLLNNLGIITYLSGNFELAEAYSQEGLALARQIGNRGQICRHLANLGRVAVARVDASAVTYLQEAVDLARQLGNNESLPLLLMNLGEAYRSQKDFDRSNAAFQESVELGRQQKAWWAVGYALMAWGELYLDYRLPDAATTVYQEVLLLTGDVERARDVVARSKYGLARVAALRNDFVNARLLGQESLDALEAIGHYKAHEVSQWLRSLPE